MLNDFVFPQSSESKEWLPKEECKPAEPFPKAEEGVRAVRAAVLLLSAGVLGAVLGLGAVCVEKCVLFARVAPVAPVVRGTAGSLMLHVCLAKEGQSCPQHWTAVLEHSHTGMLGIFKEAKWQQTFKVQGIPQVSDEHPVSIFLFVYVRTFHAKCCVLKCTQIHDSKPDLSDIIAY